MSTNSYVFPNIFAINICRNLPHNNINHIILSKPFRINIRSKKMTTNKFLLLRRHNIKPRILLINIIGIFKGWCRIHQRSDGQPFKCLGDEGTVGP